MMGSVQPQFRGQARALRSKIGHQAPSWRPGWRRVQSFRQPTASATARMHANGVTKMQIGAATGPLQNGIQDANSGKKLNSTIQTISTNMAAIPTILRHHENDRGVVMWRVLAVHADRGVVVRKLIAV
jgi:hypothetical protein